jgi:hypothetical protein
VLAWALSDLVEHLDNKDNRLPDEGGENKIDPAIALIGLRSRHGTAGGAVPLRGSEYPHHLLAEANAMAATSIGTNEGKAR